MSKYRKPFLAILKPLWAARLPAWRHGVWSSPHIAPKDSTFTNTSALASRGLVFHVVVNFTPKWPGAFTADIVVATSLDPLIERVNQRWPDDLQTLACGRYRIGWFVANRDIWWRLVDDAAESLRFYSGLPGIDAAALALPRNPDHWYASSYDISMETIMQQAAIHLTETFERHVPASLKLTT